MEQLSFNKSRSLVFADSEAYSFEITGRRENTHKGVENDKSIQHFSKWQDQLIELDGYKVFPYGKDNNLNIEIQEGVFNNNIAPRTLTKKAFLLYGQGPILYTEKKEKNKVIREYVEDDGIQSFLNDANIEDSIMSSIVDYYYAEGVYHKVLNTKGARIGESNAPLIEYQDLGYCRLAKKKSSNSNKPTHVLIGDWKDRNSNEYDVYPLFDPKEPTKHRVSISYNKLKAFTFDNYSMPDLYGTLSTIRRASAIPFIIEAYTNNSLNLKFHIQSPQKYWDDKERILKDNASKEGRLYDPKELEKVKRDILDGLTKVLSGVDNVGKFWHTTQVIELLGGRQVEHKWVITPIDQKIKDYITAQLDILKQMSFGITAGLGLHNALANVGADGKSDSGSEQLYALKNHQITETSVPEMIVCKVYNDIIKWKWPEKKIKLGFYQYMAEKEENITPSNRTINQE